VHGSCIYGQRTESCEFITFHCLKLCIAFIIIFVVIIVVIVIVVIVVVVVVVVVAFIERTLYYAVRLRYITSN